MCAVKVIRNRAVRFAADSAEFPDMPLATPNPTVLSTILANGGVQYWCLRPCSMAPPKRRVDERIFGHDSRGRTGVRGHTWEA